MRSLTEVQARRGRGLVYLVAAMLSLPILCALMGSGCAGVPQSQSEALARAAVTITQAYNGIAEARNAGAIDQERAEELRDTVDDARAYYRQARIVYEAGQEAEAGDLLSRGLVILTAVSEVLPDGQR